MAARGGIIAVIIFSCAILPLLASAFTPGSTGLWNPFKNFLESPSQEQETQNYELPSHEDEFPPIFKESRNHHFNHDQWNNEEKENEEKEKDEQSLKENEDKREFESAENGDQEDKREFESAENGDHSDQSESNPEENAGEGLIQGFYGKTCPQAERIVNDVLNKNLQKDGGLAPAIVRLFLHDCFVTGCDASILLDETPSGEVVEKKAPPNGKFVRGFETIDEMKTQLETECPGVVSCADILAYANRDSLVHTGLPTYNVAAGRRDGLSSLAKNADKNLPLPDSPVQEMIDLFQSKGLTLEDLVVLTGAHSIGTAHCGIVKGRFFDQHKSNEIDPAYRDQIRFMCARDLNTVPFDPITQHKMDSSIYNEFLTKKALLESDNSLANDPHANVIMKKLAGDQPSWFAKFTRSIIKMGEIQVLTGNQGEIRKQCRAVN